MSVCRRRCSRLGAWNAVCVHAERQICSFPQQALYYMSVHVYRCVGDVLGEDMYSEIVSWIRSHKGYYFH